jgi:DNA-binding HxlR family transcriptional regulator
MKHPAKALRSHCPVNFGLEAFGDRWALLIVRDIVFRGKRSFGEFLGSEEGFATNILASRLEHLVETGILRKGEDAADGRKALYSLTEKGLDLIPLLFEMVLWSSKHDPKSQARRIARLVELIRADNRAISEIVREKVRRGEGIVAEYSRPEPGGGRTEGISGAAGCRCCGHGPCGTRHGQRLRR